MMGLLPRLLGADSNRSRLKDFPTFNFCGLNFIPLNFVLF